jgi:ribose transport system ATP-binding protein
MVGRTLENLFPKEFGRKGACVLKTEHLLEYGVLDDVSFEAYSGQILGFAGLVGAGRTETMRAIFGADTLDGGSIYINGKKEKIKNPRHAIKNGIAFLTEDRKGQGLVLGQTVKTNLILANLKGFTKGLFLDEKKIFSESGNTVKALRIKTPSTNEITGQLSGGNQQKVVIGKWVNTNADIFIFDEPTRGIDVGAKVEVYNIMNSLVKAGKCVIMVSSEMPEILGMSDRVIVMRKGKIMANIDRNSKQFNQEDIMKAAWGQKNV